MAATEEDLMNLLLDDDGDGLKTAPLRKTAVREEDVDDADDVEEDLFPDVEEETEEATATESLEKITQAQKDLSRVKQDLNSIIESITNNPSLITQASNYWGGLPWYGQIIGGITVGAPTLAAGFTVGGATAVTIAVTGYILNDHHECNAKTIERLKSGILNLADVLQLTIISLEKIRDQFAAEIEKFKRENDRLVQNVRDLGEKIITLGNEIAGLTMTSKLLKESKIELERTAVALRVDLEEQKEANDQTRTELQQVTRDYEKNEANLKAKVHELEEVERSMQLELDKTRTIGEILQGTVNTLSGAVLNKDADKRASFQEQIQALTDRTESLDKVTTKITEAEAELARQTAALQTCNQQHKALNEFQADLVKQQREQVQRMQEFSNTAGSHFKDGAIHHSMFGGKVTHRGNQTKASEPVVEPSVVIVGGGASR